MYHERQQTIGEIDVQASIDRLTVLGKTKYLDLFEQTLRNKSTVKKVLSADFPYRKAFITCDGTWIGLKGEDAKAIPPIRVDFNPNSLSPEGEKELHEILGMMASQRLSRVDVAIDYVGKDLSNLEWHEEVERSRRLYTSRTGRLETIYLGAPSSDRQTRIYDKGLEQRVDYDWWRVESQARMKKGDKLFQDNPFSGLYAYEKGSEYEGLALEEKAVLQYIEKYPTAIAELEKRKRQHYRKLMSQTENKLNPLPHEVFEKEKGNLLQQIAVWLQPTSKKN